MNLSVEEYKKRHADRVVFINNASAVVGTVKDVYRQKDFMEVFGHIILPDEY